jgi:hypothetical protein
MGRKINFLSSGKSEKENKEKTWDHYVGENEKNIPLLAVSVMFIEETVPFQQ